MAVNKKKETAKKRGKSISKDVKQEEAQKRRIDASQFLTLVLIGAFTLVLILICFVGLSPAGPQILEDQIARIRIVSEFDFSYVSHIETEKARTARSRLVKPIYKIEMESYERFSRFMNRLRSELPKLEEKLANSAPGDRMLIIEDFVQNFQGDDYAIISDDLDAFLRETQPEERQVAIREGLLIMRQIYSGGIYEPEQTTADDTATNGQISVLSIQRASGALTDADLHTLEDALRTLRINLSPLDINRKASLALYRMLRTGLEANLLQDTEATSRAMERAAAAVKPVKRTVRAGETIIQPDMRVSNLDVEKLEAYRAERRAAEGTGLSLGPLLWERIVMTFAIIVAAVTFVRTQNRRLRTQRRHMGLAAVAILVNMVLVRIVLEIGEIGILGDGANPLGLLLPYLAPVALAAMVTSILLGTVPGVLVGLLVSMLYAIMSGNSMPILLVGFITALVGIHCSRGIQVRGRILSAGAYSGVAMAIGAMFIGLRNNPDALLIAQQMGVSLGTGFATGVLVIAVLPVFERFFKFTTDITLLELTDFNHPLLRRMQMVAPGSYHHSLMVANLSERAAAEIGANPLMCRVCALYHDIGKMVKPEYFTENQLGGHNPHLDTNPSMSALIIKAHVKEGVALAEEARLPEVIKDVILQHHGTTLIQYFYYKALNAQKERARQTAPSFPNSPAIEIDRVNESTYRYEGPKPQFKESAIIHLADCVEAASRSLKKVTPQAIDDLIDKIFIARLEDGQLTDCPMTFCELKAIKKSFSLTVHNMLHTRVEYPESDEDLAKKEREAKAKQQEEPASRADVARQTQV